MRRVCKHAILRDRDIFETVSESFESDFHDRSIIVDPVYCRFRREMNGLIYEYELLNLLPIQSCDDLSNRILYI